MSAVALSPDPAAVSAALVWVVAGQSEADIVGAMAARFPAADPGRVLAAVMVRLRDAADADPEVVAGWCVEATRDLYRRMVEAGDYTGALRAVKQMRELVKDVPNRPREEADTGGRPGGVEVPGEEGPGGGAERGPKQGRPRDRADAPHRRRKAACAVPVEPETVL